MPNHNDNYQFVSGKYPRLASAQDQDRALKGGGGDGTSGGMEARVARLESDVSHIAGDVKEIRSVLSDTRERFIKLEERVSHLPDKSFIVKSVLTTLAVVTGLIAFQQQIQVLFHLK